MSVKRRVFIVAADMDLRDLLAEQLSINDEFKTELAASGAEALDRAPAGFFDIVLLDDSVAASGGDLCRDLRAAGLKSPIVLLAASEDVSTEDRDTIEALDAGANDVIAKPFRISVLLARLRAHAREYERSEHAVFSVGRYTFHPGAKVLRDRETDTRIRLTDKETAIIKYLYLAGARVVGRDDLLGEVWGYNTGVTTHTLETHVYRLRQKIERDPANAELLVTEPNGYRLNP